MITRDSIMFTRGTCVTEPSDVVSNGLDVYTNSISIAFSGPPAPFYAIDENTQRAEQFALSAAETRGKQACVISVTVTPETFRYLKRRIWNVRTTFPIILGEEIGVPRTEYVSSLTFEQLGSTACITLQDLPLKTLSELQATVGFGTSESGFTYRPYEELYEEINEVAVHKEHQRRGKEAL